MDLTARGFLIGAVLVFVIFSKKEEGYPLEISTDDRCFFSLQKTDGLVIIYNETFRLVVQTLHNTAFNGLRIV